MFGTIFIVLKITDQLFKKRLFNKKISAYKMLLQIKGIVSLKTSRKNQRRHFFDKIHHLHSIIHKILQNKYLGKI
jgi:hypothetical protein